MLSRDSASLDAKLKRERDRVRASFLAPEVMTSLWIYVIRVISRSRVIVCFGA